MTKDSENLYKFICDNSRDDMEDLVFNIKDLREIQEADRKSERLFKELKSENRIAFYEIDKSGEVTVRLHTKKEADPINRDKVQNDHHSNQNIIYDDIHRIVLEKFVKKKYSNKEISLEEFKEYSDLFRLFICVRDENAEEQPIDNLFEFIVQKVNEISNENFVKILGPDGTGKSTFLSILYLYLYNCYREYQLSMYPFYIDLHYYEENVIESDDSNDEMKKQIQKDLEPIRALGTNLLIIIDGNEEYNRSDLKPGRILEKFLREIDGHKKIICIGEKTNIHYSRERENDACINAETAYTFYFSPIYVTERNRWTDAVGKFCKLDNHIKQERIKNCIDKFHIKEIDFNLLTVLADVSRRKNLTDIRSVSQLYSEYCLNYLDRDAKKLNNSAGLAYTYFMTKEHISEDRIVPNWKAWKLVHQHKTVSNYLLALYYSKLIESGNPDDVQKFQCVFTYGINFFLKSIIDETEEQQRDTIAFCEKMFNKGDYRAKTQAAYMAGRVTEPNLQERARKLLSKQLSKQDELCDLKNAQEDEKREQCFLRRSILVSRLYLGDMAAGEALLKELFDMAVMNEVNRAFFLQYNADVALGPQTVNLYDNGRNKISYTVKGLFNFVNERLQKGSTKWNKQQRYQFQIYLFTLCSLIQQRLRQIEYRPEIEKLKKVIMETIRDHNNKLDNNMKNYIMMLWEDINNQDYSIGHLYRALYQKREIVQSVSSDQIVEGSMIEHTKENVIEHIYYCWLLGMLYLPDEQPEGDEYNGYEKEKILKFLLIHNLSKIYTENMLPSEFFLSEKDNMYRIFMHSMYSGIGCMDTYKKVWDDLALDAKNINSKIAGDIDRIERIYRQNLYTKRDECSGEEIDELRQEWNCMETSLGGSIMEEIMIKEPKRDRKS